MKRENKSSAVREQRAPVVVEEDTPQRRHWRALDWFATPPWATRAGCEILRCFADANAEIWEPACGDGIMAEVIAEYFPNTKSSDIEPHYRGAFGAVDFLQAPIYDTQCDWIVTNPPYSDAAEFLRVGQVTARCGVALLCRTAFFEGSKRYPLFYTGSMRLACFSPFSERVGMQLGPWNPGCSTASSYGWFFFVKNHGVPAMVKPIKPGTRASLWHPNDVRRFVKPVATPLLDIA